MPEALLKPVANVVDKVIAQPIGRVLSKLGPKMPEPPAPLPPERMPTSTDQAAARRASIREQLLRRGRASTILTDNKDTLGG